MEILTYLVTALAYAGLGFYFWRTRWAPAQPGAGGAALAPSTEHAALFFPLALHAFLLGRSIFGVDGLHPGLGNALSAILELTALIYWIGNFFYRLEGLQALVLPLAAAAVIVSAVTPQAQAL